MMVVDRQIRYVFLSLLLFMPQLWAATCSDIFSNGLQAHGNNGNISLGYQTRINGGTSTLQTRTLTDNSQHLACNSATCVPSGVASVTSTVTFQTGSASNGAIDVPYQGSLNVSPGDYGAVNVAQEGSLRFNTNDGLYLMRGVTTGYRSEIRLRPGDYWIDGDLNLSQETVLRRITTQGSSRIFVRGNVTIGYQVTTADFTADQLLIYATGNIHISQASNLRGFLYAGGNVDIGYGVTINGAVAGFSIYANAGQSITNYQGNLLATAEFAPFCSGVTSTPVLLGSWRMDEGNWNGTANEVIDSSGNGNHGRARVAAGTTSLPTTESGSPAYTSGNQSTCYYGSFDRTSSPVRTYSYVELTGFPSLPNGFTFAAWIRSTNAGAQHQRILVRDDDQNGWGLSLADGTGQPKLRFFARNVTNNGNVTGQGTNPNCGVFCIDTHAVLTSNVWYYVAAAVDTTAKTVTLYVYNQSGVLQARTAGAYSGTWTDGSGTAAIGGETSDSSEGRQTSWHFLGNIDEVNIYSGALAQASIESLMRTVRACAGPDHYELEVASESIACEGAMVRVRACANSLVPCTLDLSVNTNVGLVTNAGSLAASTLTLSAGQATTRLLYPAAVDGALAVLNLQNEQTTAINARKCCTGSSSCSVANSCSTQFKTAGFIFSNSATGLDNIPSQLAGVEDSSVYLRAVKTNTATGTCISRFSSPQSVQLAYQCINPGSCIVNQHMRLGGTSVQANMSTTPLPSLGYTNKLLNFDSNGSAAIPLNYTDAGQVRLHARLALEATATEPAYILTGTSNDFVVKPYQLVVSSVIGGANQTNPGTSGSGTGFIAAGESFSVSLEARNQAGDLTPNFGREVTPEYSDMNVIASSLAYPSGGTLTELTNGGSFVASATAGRFENNNFSWNQVGSIRLTPALGDSDYLGAGNIPSLPESNPVGRFYPHHYRLMSATTSNSCGSFSYMSQPAISLSYSLVAESSSGVILSNYDNTDQVTPYAGAASLNYVVESANNGVDLGARLVVPFVGWDQGLISFNQQNIEFSRQIGGGVDGPFTNLQLGLALIDSLDNRPLQALDMNPSTNLICSGASCTAKTLGSPLNVRYGRLRLDDAFGPESVDLPVNFVTEYWTGSFFRKNTDDACSRVLRSAISYPSGNILNPANLNVPLNGGTTQGVYANMNATEVAFNAGDARHYFQAPGSGMGGFTVDIDLTSYPWLRYDWDQDNDYSDILLRARFGFGQYRGHDRIIYWRERFD